MDISRIISPDKLHIFCQLHAVDPLSLKAIRKPFCMIFSEDIKKLRHIVAIKNNAEISHMTHRMAGSLLVVGAASAASAMAAISDGIEKANSGATEIDWNTLFCGLEKIVNQVREIGN